MKSLNFALGAMIAAGTAALVAAPSTAQAQYPGGAGYGQPTGPDPALVEARKQIVLAEKEVARLRGELTKLKARLQAKYETKDDWETAKANLKAAEAANDAARKRAMAKLVLQPDYKAAKDKQVKADQQVAALDAQGDKADPKALAAAQQARVDAGLTVRKMETEAVDNDPKAAEAKEKLAAAKKAWEALQDELKQVLEQDADYQAAQQELEQAQASVTQQKDQMKAQQAQAAAARRAQQESERAAKRASSGSGSRSSGRGYGGGR